MKSLNFTLLKDKLLDGSKRQTIRCLFIPTYEIGETIRITFKKKEVFRAVVTEMYPKQLKDITEEEAAKDGFESKEACIAGLKRINSLKSEERWCFIVRFRKVNSLDSYLEECK